MAKSKITTSSTAEYFSKNLQQVGFSSPTKAVLTTLKEAIDNSLDACEDHGILPDIYVEVERIGSGSQKNTDSVRILVEDNGPGLDADEVPKVFGEYLASSKFGRGRCSRGQQGIGISAATTWAQLTSTKGAKVVTKTKGMKQALSCEVQVDIKNNKGVIKNKKPSSWDRPHGLSCEFIIDGRIMLNGEGGILTYLTGTALVNPHVAITYQLPEQKKVTIERISKEVPKIPEATEPHPHTMKLGEFVAHSHLYGGKQIGLWLKAGFSRITDNVLQELVKAGLDKKVLKEACGKTSEGDFQKLFTLLQKIDLMSPSTRSVMIIGEEALAKSVSRLGVVNFFAVNSRKPRICDAKPVTVEVAIARLEGGNLIKEGSEDGPVTVLRFANRVPLQFDKSSCAMFKAVQTVNWKSYGLQQPKGSLPLGPYVVAVSLVSPFIKFKNASKETVDASDELVEEIRRALMQAGQRLSRHIRKEFRAADLERKNQHIEQFAPILVECLCRITKAPATRKKKATDGLMKLLDRELKTAKQDLQAAEIDALKLAEKGKLHLGDSFPAEDADTIELTEEVAEQGEIETPAKKGKNSKAKTKTKVGAEDAEPVPEEFEEESVETEEEPKEEKEDAKVPKAARRK